MESTFEISDVKGNGKDRVKEISGSETQGFGPSIAVWEQLKKTKRKHLIIASLVSVLLGIVLGAGITAIIFTQTSKTKNDVSLTESTPTTAIAVITNVSLTESTPTTAMITNTTSVGTTPTTASALSSTTAPSSTWIVTSSSITTTVTESTTAAETNQIHLTTSSTDITKVLRLDCDFEYEGKCFRAIVGDELIVHFNQSKVLCEDAGMGLANVYSKSHYFMIEGYLRSKFPASGYISAWTGITINPKNSRIVLSTGESVDLQDVRWMERYPQSDPEYIHIGLDLLKFPDLNTIYKQGLWNSDSLWDGNTAICEDL